MEGEDLRCRDVLLDEESSRLGCECEIDLRMTNDALDEVTMLP